MPDAAGKNYFVPCFKQYQPLDNQMSDDVDSRIMLSLHPKNVRQTDGCCERTAAMLGPTESAFCSCYEGLREVNNFRELAAGNATWTEAAQIIETDNLARKHSEKAARTFDITRSRLLEGIASMERELASPIANKASLQISGETRAFYKSLSTSERMSFVNGLIESGDELSVSAVCGGPTLLSGLTPEMLRTFTRMWNERSSLGAMLRLKAMRGAATPIERNAPLVHDRFAKAVGCRPDKAQALRDAITAAEKAAIFRHVA